MSILETGVVLAVEVYTQRLLPTGPNMRDCNLERRTWCDSRKDLIISVKDTVKGHKDHASSKLSLNGTPNCKSTLRNSRLAYSDHV